jgi:hypothetical protein
MSKIEFISHDSFPEDEYTKELVYLCLEGKYRVAYIRKKASNGGLFWSVASLGIKRNGQKEYFPAFLQDSNFLERDIKEFLEKRKWENRAYDYPAGANATATQKPRSMDEVADNDQLPF